MRAAIYARHSDAKQSYASIDDQVRLCWDFIARQGRKVVGEFADRAISARTLLRPGFQKLLEEARKGSFDVVVAEGLDRLWRDQDDIANFYKRLSISGIRLVTTQEVKISELYLGLKGTMNAVFFKDLAAKTRRGLEGRVKSRHVRRRPGLRLFREEGAGAKGELIRGERKIVPHQAGIVQRVFRAFADGKSPRAIARQLNEADIPGPDSRPWRDTTIRGHREREIGILNNELNIGRLIWNRLAYVKDPVTGKRRSRRNAPEALVVEEVPALRIVDNALWQRLKARQAEIDGRPGVQKIKASRF